MKGRSTDIAHSRRVGKNWVMTGLWIGRKNNFNTKEGLKCSFKVTQPISNSNLQTLHRPCDVELVHGVDNDGGSGEEEEQQEEEDV